MQALDFRKTNHNKPETWALFPANTRNVPSTPPDTTTADTGRIGTTNLQAWKDNRALTFLSVPKVTESL